MKSEWKEAYGEMTLADVGIMAAIRDRAEQIVSEAVLSGKSLMECLECGKKFSKRIGRGTIYVRCPGCGSYDTDLR